MISRLILPALLLSILLNSAGASGLADSAASMDAGDWIRFDNGNIPADLFEDPDGFSILGYTDNGLWDPVSKTFFFLGAYHNGQGKFITYHAATDTWAEQPLSSLLSDLQLERTYDHLAINPVMGEIYYRLAETRKFFRYEISSATWDTLPDNRQMGFVQCCGALEYFPELGGLLFFNGGETKEAGSLYFLDDSTRTWSCLADTIRAGDLLNLAEYNPVTKTVLLGGGGDSSLYKIDSFGSITRLSDAPIKLGMGISLVTSDPVTGKYLVFGNHRLAYAFDILTDTWTALSGQMPFYDNPGNPDMVANTIAAPVSNYGVNLLVMYSSQGTEAYLYRHAPGTAVEFNTDRSAPAMVEVMPNPFSSTVTIQIPIREADTQVSNVNIFDLTGKKVTTLSPVSSHYTWRPAGLSKGIYFVRINTGTLIVVKKIFLQ